MTIRAIRQKNRESGNALVEFSLSMVVILTVLFGIIDMGRALYSYDWLSDAARRATRYAMVRPNCMGANGCNPNCGNGISSLPCQAQPGDIQSYVVSLGGLGINTSPVGNVCPVTSSGYTLDVCSQCFVTGTSTSSSPPCTPGTWVSVQLAYKFSLLSPLIPLSWTMHSSSQRVAQ